MLVDSHTFELLGTTLIKSAYSTAMDLPVWKNAVIVLLVSLTGHWFVQPILRLLWRKFYELPGAEESVGDKEIFEKKKFITATLGFVERLVFSGSWLIGGKEIILAILAIKAQPGLKEWSENKMLGRTQFNIWLIGNLLNVIVSVGLAEGLRELAKALWP